MVLSFFYLIQAQPQKTPWIVWAAAIVLFVVAVSGIVYFLTRLKRVEKEPEEEWTLSTHSLLGNAVAAKPEPAKSEPARPVEPGPTRALERETAALGSVTEKADVQKDVVRQQVVQDAATGETAAREPEVIERRTEALVYKEEEVEEARETTAPLPSQPETVEPAAVEVAEVAEEVEEVERFEPSPSEEPVVLRETAELTPFDDEVWAGLDAQGEPFTEVSANAPQPPDSRQPSHGEGTQPLVSARIDERSRARFETPRIEPVSRRAPFEPPRIEPLKPRESANRGVETATRPLTSQRHPEPPRPAAPAPQPAALSARPVSAAPASGRKVAGSVLGLPAERSQSPLVLGVPELDKENAGIGSLTRYGRETDEPRGHGGTIALVLAILLVAGAVVAYLYVPEFQNWVNEKAARVRNRGQAPAAAQVEQPKASIFPATNPEVNKNIVKARGAVDNRSEEPLEGLFVEVSLERADGSAETRNVPVTPAYLAPRQRGIYEFEYDGKQFRGYTVMKLTSNGTDVKFISPNQQRPAPSTGG
ncbi:MAG TPA: hypothetical protein VJQ56_07490 [Blastocatellia bacterium]|nr:hypothetical protein [Blastocatellia bacterium]